MFGRRKKQKSEMTVDKMKTVVGKSFSKFNSMENGAVEFVKEVDRQIATSPFLTECEDTFLKANYAMWKFSAKQVFLDSGMDEDTADQKIEELFHEERLIDDLIRTFQQKYPVFIVQSPIEVWGKAVFFCTFKGQPIDIEDIRRQAVSEAFRYGTEHIASAWAAYHFEPSSQDWIEIGKHALEMCIHYDVMNFGEELESVVAYTIATNTLMKFAPDYTFSFNGQSDYMLSVDLTQIAEKAYLVMRYVEEQLSGTLKHTFTVGLKEMGQLQKPIPHSFGQWIDEEVPKFIEEKKEAGLTEEQEKQEFSLVAESTLKEVSMYVWKIGLALWKCKIALYDIQSANAK